LIFSFLYIDPDTYEITPMASNQEDLYVRFTALKDYDVETWISIGGWAMNDPGDYSHVFSDLAASTSAQTKFLSSLKSFLKKYGFDGVDIDWCVI
jgi:chitinase